MDRPTRRRAPGAGEDARGRWTAERTGEWYERSRWSNAARRRRDPDLVDRILRAHAPEARRVLDAPAGTGRLRNALEAGRDYTGAEISAAMLERARAHAPAACPRLVQADATRLPFREDAFDAVVCCRLLHHLRTREELEAVMRELVRVSADVVAASFWDSGSLAAWRMRLPFTRTPRDRVTHAKALVVDVVESAGARLVAWQHSLRYLSQHTWFVARKVRGDA